MDVYDPLHQISSWIEGYRDDTCPNIPTPTLLQVDEKIENQSEYTCHGVLSPSSNYEQETSKSSEKVQRRLAQNREAARKSRIRKKAYVQQLELSRLKLVQLEQELQRARNDTFFGRGAGIAAFEMEYGKWLEEQKKQICEMRVALQDGRSDVELRILVERCMKHYMELFRMKSKAARANVFYLMSGMWKSAAERFFFWIGGFRPSDLLKVLIPLIEPLSEKQRMDVSNLQQSCQQAEDALSQGMERLQQTLAETVAAAAAQAEQDKGNSYVDQMAIAVERLDALVSFVNQADHLRQEALQQMHRILTIRQAGRGLLVLGEYLHRLIALSSLWVNRPPSEPA
ncbi:hypothetical protein V2J09_002269 [Rumex salicifolius]